MKIFVAGATGAVGKLLLPKLVNAGHDVTGMTRRSEKTGLIEETGSRAVVVDVYNRREMRSLLEAIQPDVVIHQLTALSERDFAENNRVRMEGTRSLVDACHSVGVTHIIAQSVAWAYVPGDGPAVEEEAFDTEAAVPSRKRFATGVLALEQAVSEVGHHVILRYGKLYGPGTWYDSSGLIADEVRRREVKATLGVTSFTHVEDAAQTAVEALKWPAGRVNIVDDEPAPGVDWLPVYAHALNAPMPDIRGSHEAWERGASNAKARKQYGWKPMYSTWRTGFGESLG